MTRSRSVGGVPRQWHDLQLPVAVRLLDPEGRGDRVAALEFVRERFANGPAGVLQFGVDERDVRRGQVDGLVARSPVLRDGRCALAVTVEFRGVPRLGPDMILSDADILDRLETGDLVVEPLDDPDLQVQPASVDLRLGAEFLEFQHANIPCIHPNAEEEVEDYVAETVVGPEEEFVLHPGDFVLGTTYERVEVPADLIAHVQGRSSLGRLAVVVHATAGVVDPGYRGQITLELSNLGTAPVALTPGMRISQLIFTELRTGPQASRIGNDDEFGGDQRPDGDARDSSGADGRRSGDDGGGGR
jgi:dCTP deaminase